MSVIHRLVALIPWERLDTMGFWRIPKFFYEHNWWPLRGIRAHDEANGTTIPDRT